MITENRIVAMRKEVNAAQDAGADLDKTATELQMIELGLAGELNTTRMAEMAGLTSFDCALPQGWVDAVQRAIDCDPRGHFVWCYDRYETAGGSMNNILGYPYPVTLRGIQIAGLLSRGYDL